GDRVQIHLGPVQGGVLRDPSHAGLRALQGLARRWGASVVAERVETPGQLATILAVGIGAGQGYLPGRPDEERTSPQLDRTALAQPGVDGTHSALDRALGDGSTAASPAA